MKNEVIEFNITQAAISVLASKYLGIEVIDVASYKMVVSGIAEIRTLRVSVEKRRKELKKNALQYGRRVDNTAKTITENLLVIEENLKTLKRVEDIRKEAIKAEKERVEQDRIDKIKTLIASFPPEASKQFQILTATAIQIKEMQERLVSVEIDPEIYQEFSQEAIKAKTDKLALLQGYYISRIQIDAAATKQKAKEEAIKAEVDRQEAHLKKQEEEQKARQAIEVTRLAKIREEQEIEAQKLRGIQAKIDIQNKAIQDEKDRLENERIEREQAEQERLAQIEKDRLEIERKATEKIEAEKREQARIKEEAEKKAAREKAAADEKKRQAILRPDKENLAVYFETVISEFNNLATPALKTKEGKSLLFSFIDNVQQEIHTASARAAQLGIVPVYGTSDPN